MHIQGSKVSCVLNGCGMIRYSKHSSSSSPWASPNDSFPSVAVAQVFLPSLVVVVGAPLGRASKAPRWLISARRQPPRTTYGLRLLMSNRGHIDWRERLVLRSSRGWSHYISLHWLPWSMRVANPAMREPFIDELGLPVLILRQIQLMCTKVG